MRPKEVFYMGKVTKKYKWGYSVIDFHGLKYANTDSDDQIHTISTAVIKARTFIPLHIQFEGSEQYQALTWGLHALTLSLEEASALTDTEILKQLKDAPQMKISEVSTCHKGQLHILYNSSDIEARLKIINCFED